MNRRERRKAQRERMKLVKGGKADEAAPGIDLETPAGRFAQRLDEVVKSSLAADLQLEELKARDPDKTPTPDGRAS